MNQNNFKNNMKTILVPTDFSKDAETALFYAIDIANKTKAKIILLHSFHISYTSGYVPENRIEKDIQEATAKWNKDLKNLYDNTSHHSKNPVEFISTENSAVDAILSVAKERKVDLIIMGTQGINKIVGRQIFGTKSSKIIEQASCPVMIVPEERIHNEVKKMVYATEFLESDIPCLQSLTEIAKAFDAEIEVVHISAQETESVKEKEQLENFKQQVLKNTSYAKLSFKRLAGNGVEQKLEAYMQEDVEMDMLVMSAHHRNFKDKLFGRSHTKAMALYVKIPLLVFHHERNKSDDAADHIVDKLIF